MADDNQNRPETQAERNQPKPAAEPKRRQGAPAVADDADEGIGLLVIGLIAGILIVVLPLSAGLGGGEVQTPTATTEAHDEAESTTTTEAAEEVEETTTTEAVVVAEATVELSDTEAALSGTFRSEVDREQAIALLTSAYGGVGPTDVSSVDGDATVQVLHITGAVSDPAVFAGAETATEVLGGQGYEVDNSVELLSGGGEENAGDESELEVALFDLLQLEAIEFETGTAEFTPSSLSTLDKAAAILKEAPDATVEVQGHTDSRGDADANLVLSQQRADAVVVALQERGVETTLVAKGYGESDLEKDPENNEADLQANRRIEFKQLS